KPPSSHHVIPKRQADLRRLFAQAFAGSAMCIKNHADATAYKFHIWCRRLLFETVNHPYDHALIPMDPAELPLLTLASRFEIAAYVRGDFADVKAHDAPSCRHSAPSEEQHPY